MMAPDPSWTDVVQTILVGLQLVVLATAAVFGWSQLREAKKLREQQTRPFVVIDLDSAQPKLFDLVIKNLGPTIARDVRFHFEPALESTIEHWSPDRLKMFRDGIATLPPHKEIRALFEFGIDRHASGLPDVYEVTVTYRGPSGRVNYEETLHLDFGVYWNRMSVTTHNLTDLYKEVAGIHGEIRKWTAHFGGGLLHVTPDDIQKRVAESERQFEKPPPDEADL